MADTHHLIADYLLQSGMVLQRLSKDTAFTRSVERIAAALTSTLRNGGKILVAGNGGSAADAMHIAGEFVGRFALDRPGLAAVALTVDSSALTAIGNDYGYEHVFSRQVQALGQKGDAFIALSTSGTSPNVIAALKAARAGGLATIGFCGLATDAMKPLCDHVLACAGEKSPVTPSSAMIQQVYMTAAHLICGLVERDIFARSHQGAR